VAFIAGSFAAVLLLASVIDPELVMHFEITPHRTVLFYIGVFASVLAVARGMIPEDNRVFDPELLMTEVIQYTHYMPDEWKGELHSKKVGFQVFLPSKYPQCFATGSPRIWRAFRDENSHFRSGDSFGLDDTVHIVVLVATMRTRYRRLFP
jgi:hypothetical protein